MDLNHISITNILTNHAKLGLTVPAPIEEARENIAKIRAGVNTLTYSDAERSAAISAAILDGRDPATDPEVIRLVVLAQIVTNDTTHLEADARTRLLAAFLTEAPNLVKQWQKLHAKNAAVLAKEAAHLGPVDLDTDSEQILTRGGDIASHYIAAREANQTCELIRDSVGALDQVTRLYQIDRSRKWNLVHASVDLDQWEADDLYRPRTAWQLTTLGHTVELADPNTYRQRIASHAATQARRAQAGHDQMMGKRDLSGLLR